MAETLRVLIVDDEPLARQRIEDLLAKQAAIEVAGTAATGDEAIDAIRRLRPDLVFLDVQMPGKSGLQVLAELGAERTPAVIFTTAYDQFAVKAFELAAVDYLVKPFDDERFAQALRRARAAIELEEVGRVSKRLVSLLESESVRGAASKPETKSERADFLERIPVELRGQVRVVPVEKIDYITASGPYAELHVGDRTFAVRERMQALDEKLDPAAFFRIHRSFIVRLDRVDSLRRASGGDYAVKLKDGTELSVSRSRREELERRLGMRR